MRHLGLPALVLLVLACGSNAGSGNGFGDAGSDAGAGDGSVDDGSGCASPKTMCGASCVDTSSDAANCGSCGNPCGAGTSCCSGSCSTSCALVVSGVDPDNGWQNGGDWLTVHGVGFAPGMRVMLGDGRAPVHVVDAQTARIQTPPDVAGYVDVTVSNGGATSTRKGAFLYKAGGLLTPWQKVNLVSPRGEHPGMAVLQDGRVLVTGGTTKPDDPTTAQSTAEIFDRPSETLSAAKNAMATTRWFHAAVTLLTGKVLVVGGACDLYNTMICPGDQRAADLFDPSTGSFTPTAGKLAVDTYWTRAVLLPDGRVLVSSSNDPSLQVYDPDKDSFSVVGATAQQHNLAFTVRLRDGRVLIGASEGLGSTTAVELFDPDTNKVTPVGPLNVGRGWLTAHTIPDGRVLVIAGDGTHTMQGYTPLDSIEIFDPKTMAFTIAPYKLAMARFAHASALVRDGTILVIGGYNVPTACTPPADTPSVEQIDPVKGTVTKFADLPDPITESNAVTLQDGSVLTAGGGGCGVPTALPHVDFLPGQANH